MQTFLPYPEFRKSASALDRARLGKQRVETLQIMKTLVQGGGWKNHPAVLMWRGHETALMYYQEAICAEWTSRGYRDTCLEKTQEIYAELKGGGGPVPSWLGNYHFHRSHQSNLLRKDSEHYGPMFPGVPDDLEYVWPVRNEEAA